MSDNEEERDKHMKINTKHHHHNFCKEKEKHYDTYPQNMLQDSYVQ